MIRRPYPTPAQERAVLESVIYASLFDYPLTLEQLHETLVDEAADSAAIAAWYDGSAFLQARIEWRDGYFFPVGRADLPELRRRREELSRAALDELRAPLRLVLGMPFVRMVAISGSLAHLNAEGDADLDLFVITRAGRAWTVMVTVLLLARLFGWRKRLCLNYVVSERALAVEPRDLFSANQIVHLQPLLGAATYRRFLHANRFVTRFYPNFQPRPVDGVRSRSAIALEVLLHYTVGPVVERVCRAAYGRYLRRTSGTWQSSDQVRLDAECLKLHTSSHRAHVMQRFERAKQQAVAPSDLVAAR